MLAPDNPVLGRRWRGAHLESQHRGAWALVTADGTVVDSHGDPSQMIFARSSSKSLQALPLITSGAADRFGFGDRHIALALASHSGEEMHLAGVQAMLDAIGLDATALQCGPLRPIYAHSDRVAEPLCHCCSGKHAGFLAAALALGDNPEAYLSHDSAVQQHVRDSVLVMTGCDPSDIALEIDGCNAPTYCLPLRSLGVGIARIANAQHAPPALQQAADRIAAAAAAHPEMVAGASPARFDTAIMQATAGRLFAKEGADGVQVIGVRGADMAFVGKCDDGTLRAIWPLAAAVLRAHDLLSDNERLALGQWCSTELRNAAGNVTGHHEVIYTRTS